MGAPFWSNLFAMAKTRSLIFALPLMCGSPALM
jgi:hypothetical protein